MRTFRYVLYISREHLGGRGYSTSMRLTSERKDWLIAKGEEKLGSIRYASFVDGYEVYDSDEEEIVIQKSIRRHKPTDRTRGLLTPSHLSN